MAPTSRPDDDFSFVAQWLGSLTYDQKIMPANNPGATDLEKGTVLAVVTDPANASFNQLQQFDPASTVAGVNTIYAIAGQDIAAGATAVSTKVVIRNAAVNSAKIVWPAGATATQIAAWNLALEAKNINVIDGV